MIFQVKGEEILKNIDQLIEEENNTYERFIQMLQKEREKIKNSSDKWLKISWLSHISVINLDKQIENRKTILKYTTIKENTKPDLYYGLSEDELKLYNISLK